MVFASPLIRSERTPQSRSEFGRSLFIGVTFPDKERTSSPSRFKVEREGHLEVKSQSCKYSRQGEATELGPDPHGQQTIPKRGAYILQNYLRVRAAAKCIKTAEGRT